VQCTDYVLCKYQDKGVASAKDILRVNVKRYSLSSVGCACPHCVCVEHTRVLEATDMTNGPKNMRSNFR
jgi:hypothetical protein